MTYLLNRAIARLVFPVLLFGFFAAAAAAQSTIFIVRHAEKAESGGTDPDLSEPGKARAESLANILKDAGITAIYTTEFKRTQETAAPLAKILGIAVDHSSGKIKHGARREITSPTRRERFSSRPFQHHSAADKGARRRHSDQYWRQ